MYNNAFWIIQKYKLFCLNISLFAIQLIEQYVRKRKHFVAKLKIFKSKRKLLVFTILCFCPQFVIANESDDYYWQGQGSSGSYPSPEIVCELYLQDRRSRPTSDVFDWQLTIEDATTAEGVPHKNCILNCGREGCDAVTNALASASPHKYKLGMTNSDESLECGVGNPIDPNTGNKFQLEPLIQLASIHPISFNLIYNSQRPEKWRHNYTQSVVSVSNAQRPGGLPVNQSFCQSNAMIIESSGGFNDAVVESVFVGSPYKFYPQKIVEIPQVARTSAQDACAINWSVVSDNYHYAWMEDGTTAEYIGSGKCSIKDANGIEHMKLNVYRNKSGLMADIPFESCEDLDPRVPPNLDDPSTINVRFTRSDGRLVRFTYNPVTTNLDNKSYTGEKSEFIVSGTTIAGYRFYNSDDEVEEYDDQGRLISITSLGEHVQTISYAPDATTGAILLDRVQNTTGEYIQFSYETVTVGEDPPFNRINGVTDHSSRNWGFRYDGNDNLEFVDLPDTRTRQYHYEDTDNVDYLTGVTDESGTRYASWTYNSNKKADSSAHGPLADIDKVSIAYRENNNQHVVTKVRRSLLNDTTSDITSTYKTHATDSSKVVAEITGDNNDVKFEHHPITGHLEYKIEHGLKTEYSDYNGSGDPGTVVEAVGTAEQRQTSYTYDARYHSKVATITEASVFPGNDKVTTNQYDGYANNTAIIIDGFATDGTAVSRSTSFQYNGPFNQLSQIDGPRTDVSDIYSIDYYADDEIEGSNRARMKSITAPLGIALYSDITYTPTGKISTYQDANNVQLTVSYYLGNDRLDTLEQYDPDTGERRLTKWTYLATGEVETITTGYNISEQTMLTLKYDTARRLTGIVNDLGNSIEYILDSEGNVEQENIRETYGAIEFKKQLTQTFDDYDRLQLRTQVNEQLTEIWSADGTLDKTVDGNNVTTDYGYDDLRRLTTIVQDQGGSSSQTENALTQLNYDVQDNLTLVTNAVDGTTVFSYDDLGNQFSRNSKDTGNTIYTHDDAGNILTMLDANNETISYSYDALNRLTSITTSNESDDVQYEYDNCQNGAGRLCKVSNSSSSQYYRYDAFGNVIGQQSLQYTYDSANRLKTITYPSSAIVHYDYDAAGQVAQVSLERNGSIVPLANNITYEPFGDFNNLLYGNGLTLTQSKDSAYRSLTQNILDVFELNYTQYDANGNLKQRDDTVSGINAIYNYDEHDRLSSATGEFGVKAYEYDKNANRTKLTDDGTATDNSYDPMSNRLSMRGLESAELDNNGNTLNLGERSYSYSKHNRLFQVFDSGELKATYQHNGLGQRISKTLPDGSGKYFIYGTDGKLMAETDINGNILFEYIYFNGQLLAKYSPDSDIDGISNYEEDQLGTNPITSDQDGDGLSDIDEMFIYGTSVSSTDTDGDGVSDGDELVFNSNPLDSNINYGDINLNGEFNVGDYVVLMQFVMGSRSPNPTEQEQADINQDGEINLQDMLLMQRVLMDLEISWFEISVDGVKGVFAEIYDGIIPPAYAAIGDGDIYYVHNDHLGTPLKMTNEIGFVVWSAVYDPFGKAAVNEDVDGDGKTVEMNVRFPGQYYDGESGLHYNYFRTYDPELGRYITSDPIGLFGGVNTFGYVGGNPVALKDENGLCPWCAGAIAGGVSGFYGAYVSSGGDIGSMLLGGATGFVFGGMNPYSAFGGIASAFLSNVTTNLIGQTIGDMSKKNCDDNKGSNVNITSAVFAGFGGVYGLPVRSFVSVAVNPLTGSAAAGLTIGIFEMAGSKRND